ncbi:hypothetical protein CUU66_00065 [Peribacillus deserti]|uniref:Uncharacterized protein n=1 Tax=Peribacillus deserti TaxID=673318 RepID=A0A2N5MBY8_9BACI|nr:hypothetical protein CUU66_00065 [Peribacillus deserti]
MGWYNLLFLFLHNTHCLEKHRSCAFLAVQLRTDTFGHKPIAIKRQKRPFAAAFLMPSGVCFSNNIQGET